MNLLVTAGATREAIDDVRFISNASTGRTGAALAAVWARRGHAVTLLRGAGAAAAPGGVAAEEFSSAEDLESRLHARLATGRFDGIAMAAAVADYRPERFQSGKFDSARDAFDLRLVRTPKILPRLKSFSPAPLAVVGFKLTVGADERAQRAAVEVQLGSEAVDWVVHNDLEEIRAAALHPFRIFGRAEGAAREIRRVAGAEALAEALAEVLEERPRPAGAAEKRAG